jgi:ADP-ribose pyrophosphatase YjhB (NUDIX family)
VINCFNIRVYGILINNGQLLVSDEYIKKNKITKFPGGGLEFGEGLKDCLIREFKEELNLSIKVIEHFYTTDFYVNSSFDTNSQIISIYYIVYPLEKMDFNVSLSPHNYETKEGAQSVRWIKLSELKENDFSLIIDRKVGEMLINNN